jgi:hypothetical protein
MSRNYWDKKSKGFEPPRATPAEVSRFGMDDLTSAMKYLDDQGYVVIRGVANNDEIAHGIDLAWNFVEGLCRGGSKYLDLQRENPKTWDHPAWPDPYRKGIIASDGVGQSEFLWFCRGLKNVLSIFKAVWNVEDLISSFDGFCFHRAFEYNQAWKTDNGAWYHTDQNGCNKPDRMCIQGFLNFLENGIEDGGLIVVPGSHKIFNDVFDARRQKLQSMGDFIPFSKDEKLWNGEIKKAGLSPIKVACKAGDFVLWDSRTIHCNESARSSRPLPKDGSVLPPRRIVSYICMTPASRLTETVHANRIQAYTNGDTTSHWPEDVFTPSVRKNNDRKNYKPVELTEDQKKLIPM